MIIGTSYLSVKQDKGFKSYLFTSYFGAEKGQEKELKEGILVATILACPIPHRDKDLWAVVAVKNTENGDVTEQLKTNIDKKNLKSEYARLAKEYGRSLAEGYFTEFKDLTEKIIDGESEGRSAAG